MGKFGPKKSKLFVLTENWHTWHLGSVDSEYGLRFLKFRPQNPFLGKFWSKKSKLSLFLENWHTLHLDDGDSYSNISFLNFQPLIHFWANLGQKSQGCLFCLKIGIHVISRLLILVPTLAFWISKPKSIFGQIWTEKLKVVQFGWKLAYRVSRRCWFLFQHYFSQFPTLNPFLNKFGPKNSNLFIVTENWHTWYIEDPDSYSDNSFLNCLL